MSEEEKDHASQQPLLTVPQQEQPFARFVYAPTAARSLQQRRLQHDPLAQLSGGTASSLVSSASSPSAADYSATLIWIFDPAHRWVHNPSQLQVLLKQLLRGTDQPWTVLMYSSRAKAFEHARNLSQSPVRPSDRRANLPPALQQRAGSVPLIVHALVTTYAVGECWTHVAQPLSLPLIYFGSAPEQLAEVYATASAALSSAARLDALFAIAEGLRRKDDEHGAIGALFGGIGRRGNSVAHTPYPALLASASSRIYGGRFLREAQQRWAIEEQAQAEGDDVLLSAQFAAPASSQSSSLPTEEEDALESRPNSPAYLERVARQVFGRVAAREKAEAAAEEKAKQQETQSQKAPLSATRGSKRIGLADAAPTLSTPKSAAGFHSAAAVAASSLATAAIPASAAALGSDRLRSASSPFRQLSVELPASSAASNAAAGTARSTRIQVIDETGRVRPISASSPAAASKRGVQFSASTGGGFNRTPKSGASSSGPGSASTSSLLSPSRTVRNPFGTASGLPSPAQVAEMLEHQVELGAPLVRPASALTSPLHGAPLKPLELTEQTEQDARAIQDIERLSAKLQAYDLPPSPSSSATATGQADGSSARPAGVPRSGLPADTMPERFAAFAAQLNRSHILDAPTRAALLEDHARQLAELPRRNLYDLERARLGSIEAKAKHRAAWMAAHAQQMQELESTKSSQLLLENDARVSSALGLSAAERQYRQDLLAVDRLSLEELARAQRAAKVEAFNAAQSTAAERALARIPEAPKLTNLQAVFLSPASRHKQKQDAAAAAAQRKAVEKAKSWAPPSAPPNRPLRRGASLAVAVPAAAASPAPAAVPTPLSPVAALASGSFVRPSASAIEAALRADFAAQDAERLAAEKRQLALEAVLYSKAKQAKVNEWLASDQSRLRHLEAVEEERNAAQENLQFKRMVREAFGDTEDEADAAARARRVQAQFGVDVVSQSHLAEEELQSRSRQKREAIFAALVPNLASDQARLDAEAMRIRMDLARSEMIAKADEKMMRELEDNTALRQIRDERRSQWSKAHPPLPTHSMSLSTRRVERRNPHEWHSEMMAM